MNKEKPVLGNLVLSRCVGQSIMIGDDIEVMVSRFLGSQVAIAIHAPKNITVHRREIWERSKRQQNAGPHECLEYAEYHIGKMGMRIATCDMCGRRWGIPDEED